MKNMEEAMMVADYSQGDHKMKFNDKENNRGDTPNLEESNVKTKEECKQDDDNKKALRDTDYGKNFEDTNGDSPSDSGSNPDNRRKKKHRRRNKGGKNHRRWKPYDKMSWTEKQELEEKETRRATQKREEAFASGHPVAPYNTTQFLMDDHCKNEAISPDLHRHNSKDSNPSNDSDSSSEFYDDEENDGFQEKNFMDTFNDIRMQELLNKSKEDLVHDYVEMEMKLERVEEKRKREASSSDLNSSGSSIERDVSYKEFLKLLEENEKLKKENHALLARIDNVKK
ncbi:protein HEXIM1-like [Ruditapes philippinarum]|uniref:protein HEXIM1-like n=1 Tax=Ruditapes philippinarum TaxID=129788 RepID=UPI00295AB414|nr:protein HEXIM1-like [Ruditapes philippinarum]